MKQDDITRLPNFMASSLLNVVTLHQFTASRECNYSCYPESVGKISEAN